MIQRPSTLLASLLGAAWLAGCSDPASEVHKSSASAAQSGGAGAAKSGKPYTITADSKLSFIGSKVTRSHNGGFNQFQGVIYVGEGKTVTGAEITIDLNSVWTDNDRLTGHLKSPDFFDVASFPSATFTVTKVGSSSLQHQVTGNLNLHGVTKSISFPASIQVSDTEVTVKAEFAINRREFNINYPGMPNDLIRDNVVIKLDVRAKPGAA
jgi:polyisoprenoid-binding protein YceI